MDILKLLTTQRTAWSLKEIAAILDISPEKARCPDYDIVISNPPYYKISKNSPHSTAMRKLIYGQPNIYALFMALATSLLRDGGEGVFITPRSFCSGLYYKKFREWFLNNVDRYFRIFNGSTQVNATDIRSMPFPSIKEIRKIGEAVKKHNPQIGYELDNIVMRILGWDPELVKQLNDNER